MAQGTRTVVAGEVSLVAVADWIGPSDKLARVSVPGGIEQDHLAVFVGAGYTRLHDEVHEDGTIVAYMAIVGPGGFRRVER